MWESIVCSYSLLSGGGAQLLWDTAQTQVDEKHNNTLRVLTYSGLANRNYLTTLENRLFPL